MWNHRFLFFVLLLLKLTSRNWCIISFMLFKTRSSKKRLLLWYCKEILLLIICHNFRFRILWNLVWLLLLIFVYRWFWICVARLRNIFVLVFVFIILINSVFIIIFFITRFITVYIRIIWIYFTFFFRLWFFLHDVFSLLKKPYFLKNSCFFWTYLLFSTSFTLFNKKNTHNLNLLLFIENYLITVSQAPNSPSKFKID